VRALHRKLARDLWRLRYQALTIAVVVGCGIASLLSALSASASMSASRDAFYVEARFAHVFARLKAAPLSVVDRLRDLPGVVAVEGRVVGDYRLEVGGSAEPVVARFVSLGWPREGGLNQTLVLSGRQVEPGRADEAVVSAGFAEAWGLTAGSPVVAVINGRRARLRVVGIAVSPEFTFASNPRTGLADARHFGIVWMDGPSLARAAGLASACNDVALQLAPGTQVAETLRRVDRVLEPFGGLGAVARADQASARLVDQKIDQLGRLARTLPVLFLAIAAFLLNVLLSRIVGTQREQIATLKALGYRTRELSLHYLELAVAICALGVLLGVALGLAGAHGLLHVYATYFKFPVFIYRVQPVAIVGAAVAAFAAGVGGTFLAVRRAVAVPPAEAMRPEPPASYRRSWLDRAYAVLSPVARMVFRDLGRRPMRLLLSAGSIALATAIVLCGSVFGDSIGEVLRLEYEVAHRQQVTVILDGARSWRAVREVAHLPGVVHAEGERQVAVRLRHGVQVRTTAILGKGAGARLHRLLDADRRPLSLPPAGLALSRVLAGWLDLHPGDPVEVELLEGDRRHLTLPVAVLVDDLLGYSAYMDAAALARVLDEPRRADRVLARVESAALDEVVARLNALPRVAQVSRPAIDRSLVQAQVADVFAVLSLMLSFFASAIAVGVVYNNARIALELRSRDLATLRILGFTRGELAALLLGEQAVQVVLGIGPGLLLGRLMGRLWLSSADPELIRVPMTIAPSSYVAAVSVVVLAAMVSALVVRRRSDALDLVAVLKARD
jgi:putative ABC transport system permease protein